MFINYSFEKTLWFSSVTSLTVKLKKRKNVKTINCLNTHFSYKKPSYGTLPATELDQFSFCSLWRIEAPTESKVEKHFPNKFWKSMAQIKKKIMLGSSVVIIFDAFEDTLT